MAIKLSMRKRRAKEGEIGLFCDTQIFEEEWAAFKMDSDVDVTATTEAHARYNRFSWHIARLIVQGTGQFNHNDDARDAVLKLCRHVEDVWDNLRGEMTVKVKPTHTLSQEEWVRLSKRMAWVAEHTFGIDPKEMSRSPYAPAPERAPEAPRADDTVTHRYFHDPKSDLVYCDEVAPNPNCVEVDKQTFDAILLRRPKAADTPREPQTEDEYVVSCRRWIATFTDPGKHREARDYFDGERHVAMRQRLAAKIGTRKMLLREIDEHFEKLKKGDGNNG